MTFVLLFCASLLTCLGQLAQKLTVERWGTGFPGVRRGWRCLWLWVGLACLGAGLALWLLVLQRLDVGLAYPMLALNVVLITLIGRYAFDEPVDARHWLGVALILLGVTLLGRQA
ncbi:4-amino-4-deoxy-L-arabinose-phosphoundecaprenol flippase subunit ArnE [Pseudomonas sp. GD03842]|uniref:4-amino-4-deoxy-L-arabinose-phosphoundecaprenol flippase subunit ArnE n=1 Tax=Pseudomonas sp. GD03842 TaxID=2975385 RepID=UPI00244A6277|nr:4-amino-4-deoxy-L-arabinose-phosphoundecaprenol flippase subunit ArnE [Pseudomonas sp. GD03842]MDH0745002.1 4-amino-4-deoxy-L-arabinose-phosphoundecaprenol flippase subunit ArnE [Pseudomonas sp. GD03842]